MVDFNNTEKLVGTPPGEVLKILILQRREFVIDTLEQYYSSDIRGASGRDNMVFASLRSLFLELQAALKRDLSDDEYFNLRLKVFSRNIADAEQAFDFLNTWLDNKRITRVDTKRHIDSDNIEEENIAEGL